MGNRTKRPPGRSRPQANRPSAFFIIALVIGLALLAWMFIQTARTQSQPKTTSQLFSEGIAA